MVQEEYKIPHKIKVLISIDLGQDELVLGLEDLKDLGILHPEFPRTMPDKRREGAPIYNVKYNSIKGDQWCEQMEMKEQREERESSRGVLLYLEERYEQVNEKISNFDFFQEKIQLVLDKYIDYRETGMKLVKDLLDQKIIAYCGDSRSEWCAHAHFVKKLGRVPLALRLVVDFSYLNDCLIRGQPQVFPTGKEIRQQLNPERVVWVCMTQAGW